MKSLSKKPQGDDWSVYEFTSRILDFCAWENKVRLDFTRPGKPTDNRLCESFNGRLRDECLNSRIRIP
jgi:transposase InsO family protein